MSIFQRRKVDILFIILICIITFAISSIYLNGEMLNTAYPDWMYHAYRALSLKESGFTSWDSIWDSGIDYWRGYQWFGAAAAVAVSMLGFSIVKSMLILTVICYIFLHLATYFAARVFGIRPTLALGVVGLTLSMSFFWMVIGFYSTMFAAALFPLFLALWKLSSKNQNLRLLFAASIGASVYIHPLLAISLFGLWIIGVVLDKRRHYKMHVLAELAIITLLSFFYWYTLLFVSYGSPDPYQLTSDFLYIVSGVFQFPLLFFVASVFVIITAILKPKAFSEYSQYLLWYTVILFLLCIITINSDVLSILNRFQLYRLGFAIAPVILILLGELIQNNVTKTSRYLIAATSVAVVGGLTQAFIYTSVYGFNTMTKVEDPVTQFLSNNKKPTGTIFMADATNASYNHPDLRFSNGYNNHLLPQHVNLRLAKLLGSTSPNFSVNQNDIATTESYMKLMGIEYLFLPQNSPYIQPLKDSLKLSQVDQLKGSSFSLTVLKVPWATTYGAEISCTDARSFQTSSKPHYLTTSSDTSLDKLVVDAANKMYESPSSFVNVTFPKRDEIAFTNTDSKNDSCYLINQSYATNWTSASAKITSTNYGMMVVSVPESKAGEVKLMHTWGIVGYIQIGTSIIAFLVITIIYIINKRKVKNG